MKVEDAMKASEVLRRSTRKERLIISLMWVVGRKSNIIYLFFLWTIYERDTN